MEITVTMLDGRSHDLTVNPQDTVSSLKTLIQNELGVPVQEQKLVFVGDQRTPLNNDSNRLSEYGLQSGSQVSLLVAQPPPVQVTQQPPVQVTQQPPVQVTQPPPVQVTQQPPVQVTQQPPVQVTQPPPVQVAQPPPFQVFLINEKHKSTTYDITPEETVDHFKARVEQREGVPVSQQRLLHQSREMTTGRLTDYNVTNHSTIHLMFRLRGGDLEKSFPDL